MKSFTSIRVGDEAVKVPRITSQMLSDIAAKWQCSKATAAEIIIARMHRQEFPNEQEENQATAPTND